MKDGQHLLLSAISEVSGAVNKLWKDLDGVVEWVTCLSTDVSSMKTGFTQLQKKMIHLERYISS